jgi:hypothetical protein
VGVVEAADRCRRHHHEAFGEFDTNALLHVQQLPERGLLGVIRTGGIARHRADALVALGDQIVVAHLLIRRVAPVIPPDPGVQVFSSGFGQPVSARAFSRI